MKIKIQCGKGPSVMFTTCCQGRIELSGTDFEPGLVMQLVQEFYIEHEHYEGPPDDSDPESRVVEVTDEEWDRAQVDGIGLVEEGTG